jgi:hypothetical protein
MKIDMKIIKNDQEGGPGMGDVLNDEGQSIIRRFASAPAGWRVVFRDRRDGPPAAVSAVAGWLTGQDGQTVVAICANNGAVEAAADTAALLGLHLTDVLGPGEELE